MRGIRRYMIIRGYPAQRAQAGVERNGVWLKGKSLGRRSRVRAAAQEDLRNCSHGRVQMASRAIMCRECIPKKVKENLTPHVVSTPARKHEQRRGVRSERLLQSARCSATRRST